MALKKLKVMTIVGTRPEILRLSSVIQKLDALSEFDHILVHTGQNYDFELSEIFFDELQIRKPKYFLECAGDTIGETYGNILAKSEKIMRKERPDAVLILGDTNSALSAIIAKRCHIPIFHMEAGNRCFDFNVPEETNRRIVDHVSDFNLVYTENARSNLISEGVPHRRIYKTGSPMNEVLNQHIDGIRDSDVLNNLGLRPSEYLLASFHREENVDNAVHLNSIIDALESLSKMYDCDIIVSTHPRTRKRMEEFAIREPARLQFLKPFGFLDYNKLQMEAICTISDSGTISEESSILGFAAVTIRNALERPEAMDAGAITLTGLAKEDIVRGVSHAIRLAKEPRSTDIPPDYQIKNTSDRVIRLLLGLSNLNSRWHGLDS